MRLRLSLAKCIYLFEAGHGLTFLIASFFRGLRWKEVGKVPLGCIYKIWFIMKYPVGEDMKLDIGDLQLLARNFAIFLTQILIQAFVFS